MKFTRPFAQRIPNAVANAVAKRLATLTLVGVALTVTSGCGNGWVSSKEREESPSALMLKAQLLYDKGKFTEAAAAYQKIVDQNPQNEKARVRLAYALNGEAGLGPLALLTKLSKIQSAPKTSSSGATTSTTTSRNSLTQLTAAAGLTSAEIAAVAKANPKTFQDLLQAETKFASLASTDPTTFRGLSSAAARFRKLQASWKTICQLIPKKVLDTVVNSELRKKALEVESCLGGFRESSQKPAILFSAAISALAQGAALYQVKLDTNNDGTVDAMKTADTITKDITALNSTASSETDPTKIKANIDSLNTKIAALNTVGETLTHDLVDLTLAQFEIMSLLMTSIEGVVPENVGKSLFNGIRKFEESKTKLSGFINVKPSSGKTSGTNQDKVTANATNASKAADAYYDKFVAENTDQTKLDEFEESFAKTCSQFDTLKSTFGSSAATKPANCQKVSLQQNLVQTLLQPEAYYEISNETPSTEELESDEFSDVANHFVEFVQLADDLLRAN